jgi:hypothetical protein
MNLATLLERAAISEKPRSAETSRADVPAI